MFYRKLKHSYFPYFYSVKYGKRYVPKGPDVRAFWFPHFAVFLLVCSSMAASQQFVDISDNDLVKFSLW